MDLIESVFQNIQYDFDHLEATKQDEDNLYDIKHENIDALCAIIGAPDKKIVFEYTDQITALLDYQDEYGVIEFDAFDRTERKHRVELMCIYHIIYNYLNENVTIVQSNNDEEEEEPKKTSNVATNKAECECGCVVTKKYLERHRLTAKHIKRIEDQEWQRRIQWMSRKKTDIWVLRK
eukprot:762966-Hanusia_phi.AAC.2